MSTDPVCVRRANNIEEAELIVAWLDECDIEATVVGGQNPGALAFGVSDFEGIGVFVSDATTADRARTLLSEHDAQHAKAATTTPPQEGIHVTCDECGADNAFAATERGKVQTCKACGAFLDISDDAVTT